MMEKGSFVKSTIGVFYLRSECVSVHGRNTQDENDTLWWLLEGTRAAGTMTWAVVHWTYGGIKISFPSIRFMSASCNVTFQYIFGL